MRDRIAVFACGWGGEYLQEVLHGIQRYCNDRDRDVFSFVNFTVHTDDPKLNTAETNLLRLPDYSAFAGAIVLANSFNSSKELNFVVTNLKKNHIPLISVEYELDDFPYITTDNYSGMYDLVDHMFQVHEVEQIVYIGGPTDHPENQERLRALQDVARQYDVEIPATNIFDGQWAKNLIPDIVTEWLDKNGSLPDAFICANDIMAIALCEYLKDIGYSVPKDVLVSGYDCLKLAQTFRPVITSVNHEWAAMGELAAKRLFVEMNGEAGEHQTMLRTSFVCGESCGCRINKIKDLPIYNSPSSNVNQMNPIDVDSHFRHFYGFAKGINNLETLHYTYSYLFQAEHRIEGEYFRICLDPNFEKVEGEELLLEEACLDQYEVVVSLKGGISQEWEKLSRNDSIFGLADQREDAGSYVIMPLYSEVYTYGFAVLSGEMFKASDNQHYIWYKHMNQALEIIRNNIRLDVLNKKLMKLSVTDALTGVYNRNGSESIIYPALIEHGMNQGKCAVMLMDINRMKLINDKYGHASGDVAILTAVRVLKENLPEGFEIARFGGDEFFIGGILENSNLDMAANIYMTAIVKKIETALEQEVSKAELSWTLTVSIGFHILEPKSVADIEQGIVVADQEMYKVKQYYHSLS